ncbi:hypothetical protein H8356DRAFT_1351341 [Neocallimastix lanati (nom. inval.)]|nr:hypothetical protein H8356DRAFT_1351341 [Neocallimastix sp. JGI-2020a]
MTDINEIGEEDHRTYSLSLKHIRLSLNSLPYHFGHDSLKARFFISRNNYNISLSDQYLNHEGSRGGQCRNLMCVNHYYENNWKDNIKE